MKFIFLFAVFLFGCGSQDIPQAHEGREFDKTGAAAFYIGGKGFVGPIVGPGTYYTGFYNQYKSVSCEQRTYKETLTALTKDGVQFSLDVYIRCNADCSDEAVTWLLTHVNTDSTKNADGGWTDTLDIPVDSVYTTFIRPAIGAAVRETVAPYVANDINSQREIILAAIRKTFSDDINNQKPKIADIQEVNLSNLDFPKEMEDANTDRATQGILKDKAIAERQRVEAEVTTMETRKKLAEADGDQAAAKIERIGTMLQKYPEYLQWNLQGIMPEIYKEAGEKGDMVIAAPSPNLLLTPGKK